MATIRFNVKPVANKKMHIRALFQDGSNQFSKYTGYSIPANKLKNDYKYWDKTKQLVKGDIENITAINSLITKWQADFIAYKDECKRLKKKIDIEAFIKWLSSDDANIFEKDTPTLLSIMSRFLEDVKKTHKIGSYRSFKVIKGKVEKFETHIKKTHLVSEIDKAFYKNFALFLMDEENNTNATILRRQGKITTIITHAIDYYKIKNVHPDYKKVYKLKTSQAAKFPLHPAELATLQAHVPNTEYQIIVLDAFLLACETGLRHSDILQLQQAHIQSQIIPAGIIKFIILNNIKTEHSNNMPISDYAAKILDKYSAAEGKIFKFHYSQSAGKVLKKIFKDLSLDRVCEIVKMQGSKTIRTMVPLHDIISFHMARNTYITRLLSNNVAPVFVQNNAGHRDIRTTMSYFRNDDIPRWQETLKILNNKN